jgi:hypothetical protein
MARIMKCKPGLMRKLCALVLLGIGQRLKSFGAHHLFSDIQSLACLTRLPQSSALESSRIAR